MIQAVGKLSSKEREKVQKAFTKHHMEIKFKELNNLNDDKIISFDKASSHLLENKGLKFYNWDLLFAVLGPNDKDGDIEKKIDERIKILKSILSLKSRPVGDEFHCSIRVSNLAEAGFIHGFSEWSQRNGLIAMSPSLDQTRNLI